jgi:hypothetical protein
MVVRLILAVILCFPVAAAAEQLTGDKAWRYIGDLGQKLTEQPYYAITLDRRNRNPQTAGFVDALVCVPGQESYRYVRRQDDNHLLSIGETGASRLQAQLIRPETLAYYRKLILDNRLKPVVILEANGRESGIVFCGINSCSVVAGSRQDGSVYLEVKKASFLSDKTELPFRVVPDTAETIK